MSVLVTTGVPAGAALRGSSESISFPLIWKVAGQTQKGFRKSNDTMYRIILGIFLFKERDPPKRLRRIKKRRIRMRVAYHLEFCDPASLRLIDFRDDDMRVSTSWRSTTQHAELSLPATGIHIDAATPALIKHNLYESKPVQVCPFAQRALVTRALFDLQHDNIAERIPSSFYRFFKKPEISEEMRRGNQLRMGIPTLLFHTCCGRGCS